MLAKTPEAPYWAVIFSTLRDEQPNDGYAQTADEMERLAAAQPGYLGIRVERQTGFER